MVTLRTCTTMARAERGAVILTRKDCAFPGAPGRLLGFVVRFREVRPDSLMIWGDTIASAHFVDVLDMHNEAERAAQDWLDYAGLPAHAVIGRPVAS